MRFGSYLINGPLMDEAADGNGGGPAGGNGGAPGGGDKTPVIDMEALAKVINMTIASQFEARDRAAATEAAKQAKEASDRKAAEEDAARKAAEDEAERKRKDGDKTPEDKALSQEMAKLRRELEEEKLRRQKTEQLAHHRDIQARIMTGLDRDDYAKASAKQLAYKAIADQVKEDETGALVGPGGVPLKDYITKMFETDLDTLLAPKKSGGSGATGATGGTSVPAPKVDINAIKPGSASLEAARAEIAALLKLQRS